MTTSKKDKLINKIKNLLDLAESKNSKNEAETAAKKAQALIMKYNIEEAEIHGGEEASIEESEFPLYEWEKGNEGQWIDSLFHAVAKFNFCKIIIHKEWIDGDYKRSLYILGEKDNIELVKYLSTQLVHRFRSARKKAWKEYDGPEKYGIFRRGFLKGCATGVYWKLEEQWEQYAEDETTAIILSRKNEALEEYIEQEHGDLKTARRNSSRSRSGYTAGVETGKNANLNAGLKNKEGNRLLNSG